MLTTTLNRIRAHGPCEDGWKKLLAGLGKTKADDEPLPYARIVEINGIDDALWCCRAEPQYAREWRLFAVWCARQVQHLMTDPRSLTALDVAERHAGGLATDEELAAARAAAWDAAWDAAGDAAWAAARAAAGDAAWDAAWDAARDAARAAAWAAAWDAAWGAQTAKFLEIVGEGRVMEKTPLRRAYSAYHAMRTAFEEIDRCYTESVEGDPSKVFEVYPGLESATPEYFDAYMSGAFEASDAIGQHLSALYKALIEIDGELAPTRGTGR